MSKTLQHGVLDFYGGAEMSNGHFGISAELSWVRSVLGPKCPYTVTRDCIVMIVNKNSNQSQALKLVFLNICYFFVLFHYLRELANVLFVFVYVYILLKQS